MYIQEPEGGFVSNIKYVRKEELNISELRSINEWGNDYREYGRKEVRHDRLIFDDEDIYNEEDDAFNNRGYEEDEYANLNEGQETKNYSIKSIYDSILSDENDLYNEEFYAERHDKKCKDKDYYDDDIYAKKEEKCDNKLKMDDDIFYNEDQKEEKCYGKKCKEQSEIIYKPEKYKKEEKYDKPVKYTKEEEYHKPVKYEPVKYEKEEVVYKEPEDKIEQVIETEDFNIIQGEIKAEIEYNFGAIGKFVKKLTPEQICDLHLCVFKYILDSNSKINQYLTILKNNMLNGVDDLLELAEEKFKQMYEFYNNALNTIGSNIKKYSEITKKQIEYKARDILDMINKFTDKLEDLFRKLTPKQIITIKNLVINVFMDCYLDKIVGAASNMEKGMSSKVNMNLNWLRRLIESYMNILCENCKKTSYYTKNK